MERAMDCESGNSTVRLLFHKSLLTRKEPGLQWLIGSPFLPPFTVISTFRCIHVKHDSVFSPEFPFESEELRILMPRGFEIVGSLIIIENICKSEVVACEAADAARRIRKLLDEHFVRSGTQDIIVAVSNSFSDDVSFFISRSGSNLLESTSSVVYDDQGKHHVWAQGCLLSCKIPINFILYFSADGHPDVAEACAFKAKEVVQDLRSQSATYLVDKLNDTFNGHDSLVFRGSDLDFDIIGNGKNMESLPCSYLCANRNSISGLTLLEYADIIQVSVFFNQSINSSEYGTATVECIPAPDDACVMILDFELDVLCYASKDLSLKNAISKLVVPALIKQLYAVKDKMLPELLVGHVQMHPYHFLPPGFVHPVTVIYKLGDNEMERTQVDARKSMHVRLGLPLDRPLLRIANALNFSRSNDGERGSSRVLKRNGILLLRDLHVGIPSKPGCSGSSYLVQGSYEYYHYLQDGFNDSGWGCAYRSLQTIISWFRLQHYTSIHTPSHREIQEVLVDIGDKDPSFIGSREWIGAIELSFVLDKLLGVTCKVINVRSGSEIPEKCRELALHFEQQGTPIMIGGGVLAYTLLGVDFKESTGDCAFLILDPHYIGNEDRTKIVSNGWCAWKKAVDKGHGFFLHDKFYNLLLPQRPSML